MAERTQVTVGEARLPRVRVENALRLPRVKLATVFWFSMALLLAVTFFFPIFFMITSSFKHELEIFAQPIHWLPHDFQGLAQ